MVALLVRLKLTLLGNGLRRSVWRTVGLVLGGVYAVGLLVLAWVGLLALRGSDVQLTGDVTIIGFSALTVAWLVLSLLVFGIDETVDPRRFALLPVPARRLVRGLFVAGLVSVPGISTVLLGLGLVATWTRSVVLVLTAALSALLGVATAFLLSRTATSAFSEALASRRFRDGAVVLLALVGAFLGIVGNLAGRASAQSVAALRQTLTSVADVTGWTPFGWAWSIPALVAQGAWGAAAVRLVLAALLVVGLWYAWAHFLAVALCSPLEAGGDSRPVSRHGIAERLYPATATGAVAARSLRYWRRDPRYLSSLASLLVAPLVIAFATTTRSGPGAGVIGMFSPAMVALLLGAVAAQDLSYDGTALWVHVTAGIPGAVDRAGRVLSSLTVVGPILAVLTVLVAVITGRWDLLARSLAVTLVLAVGSLGVATWTGSIWQIPAPPPGANPFAKNAGEGGLRALVSLFVTGALTLVVALPTLVLVLLSFRYPWLEWPALLVAGAIGAAAVLVGIRVGGRRLDRHWPEVLSAVQATE